MEEGGDNPCNLKEGEMGNEDAEEGEIIDDDDEDETQQISFNTTPSGTSTSSFNPSSTSTTTAATNFTGSTSQNSSDKSGPGLINSGLSHNSASGKDPSGSSSREASSRSSSDRNRKDENRSSSKKSDSKKSSSSTSGTSSSAGTSGSNNNSTSGAGSSSSLRNNNSSDKRKRRKHGEDSTDKDNGTSKDQSEENGVRPSKQRRESSREPGEANDTGSSDDDGSDRSDSDDGSVDFNEEFFKGMIKQMEEMLKSGKDKGQRKKREKIEKMMEKIKRLQSGSDTREMREIVRQNRRLFHPSSRDRSRDRFDRFGPRGFRDRRGRGGRMRDRMMWRDRDRDRRDFRDRDRDRDRDRFRERDKMIGAEPHHHYHHHHHHHQTPSQQQQQQQQSSSTTSSSTQPTSLSATITSTNLATSTTTSTSSTSSSQPTTTSSASTPATPTSSSSQNATVIPGHQSSKENDRDSPKNTCKFYLDGKCHKGAECPFPHDAQPPKKKDICKFYLQGFCGKGDGCLFMHGEFPCKFYHTGAECYSGDKCRFSHEPLTEETRALLKNYLDSGELPDEINRGDGSNHHSKPKRAAILGDPTEEMKTSYYTWLWQQEMKELELAYTGTKRNLFLIEKEFAITEKPPEPVGAPHPYYRNDSIDMRQSTNGNAPKVLSYYIDTMSDPVLKAETNSGPIIEDDKLIEMSFHDEDLRLPPSSGIVPPKLPPPIGAPGPAPIDPAICPPPYPGIPPSQLTSSSASMITNPSTTTTTTTTLTSTPSVPFNPQHQALNPSSSSNLASSTMPPTFSSIPANPTMTPIPVPSGPPPLLPMQPKLLNTNNEQPSSFSSPSHVNNNQYSTSINPVMMEEMPLPPLKENLPPSVTTFPPGFQETSDLGPPPPLYAVNSFNGPPPVMPLESSLNSSSSSISNQTPLNLPSAPSLAIGHEDTNHLLLDNFNQQQQLHHNSLYASSQDKMDTLSSSNSSPMMRPEGATNIPDNLPLAARHLLQRISNNQKTGAPEDFESGDLSINNESSNKSEIKPLDVILSQSSSSAVLGKSLEDARGEPKQLLSDSDDDTEDEPVKAALMNLKHAPSSTPPPVKLTDSLGEKKPNKTKLDIAKMLNVIRQTTMQVVSSQPANPVNDNKHADFWQNILSGTNLATSNSSTTSGTNNPLLDFRGSRSPSLTGSGTPPLPGTERRDPRLKRSSADSLGDQSPYQDSKSSEPVFKSDFEYRLYPISAPKIDYLMYEGMFNTDVKMKTDPRLLNFFRKNQIGSSPLD